MRTQKLAYAFSSIAIALLTHATMIDAAAQELRQCYVESIPCGTTENFDRLLHRCLQDPRLCRKPSRIDTVPQSNETPTPVSTTSVPVKAKSTARAAAPMQP